MGNDVTNRLTVRRFRPEDSGAVGTIRCPPPTDAGPSDHGASSADPTACAGASDPLASLVDAGCSWIAELDGRPVGVLLAKPIAFAGEAPLTVWVEEVVVHPPERRRGIATTLYRALGEWARVAGVRGVLTRVDPDDAAAVSLHRRVGFEAHATGTLLWQLGAG